MKSRTYISPYIGLSIIMLLIHACSKEDNPTNDKTTAVFNPDISYGSLTDQDGNTYKTVTIGTQTWMAENLRTTKYRNGDDITEVEDSKVWENLSTDAFCNYENINDIETIATYGRLYNWKAVTDDRKIAPSGWHVPSFNDWMILANNLVDSVAGIKLKESGSIHWEHFYLYGGTNETGFTALPGGCRIYYGHQYIFKQAGKEGGWWTITEDSTDIDNAYHISMGYNYPGFGGCYCPKNEGFSVRCVKD